jgi:hypothetical protein
MKLLASAFISPENTNQAALGSLLLDNMRDVPIAIQMSTVEYGGRKHTGLMLEAYVGNGWVEAYAQLPVVADNCDKTLRVMLMLGLPQFIEQTLAPMVAQICRVLSRPVPYFIEGQYPSVPGVN